MPVIVVNSRSNGARPQRRGALNNPIFEPAEASVHDNLLFQARRLAWPGEDAAAMSNVESSRTEDEHDVTWEEQEWEDDTDGSEEEVSSDADDVESDSVASDEEDEVPMISPFITWTQADALVGSCPKAELFNPADLAEAMETYARRSDRLNPSLAGAPGVVDRVVKGKLIANSSQFPTANGCYVILVAAPHEDTATLGSKVTWIPVYFGEAKGASGIRGRMNKYIHPLPGHFHPSKTETFKYHAFRAMQEREFSIQVRYRTTMDASSLENHMLKMLDLPLNKQKKATRKYRLPEIPLLMTGPQGQKRWARYTLQDFPPTQLLPPAATDVKPAEAYGLPATRVVLPGGRPDRPVNTFRIKAVPAVQPRMQADSMPRTERPLHVVRSVAASPPSPPIARHVSTRQVQGVPRPTSGMSRADLRAKIAKLEELSRLFQQRTTAAPYINVADRKVVLEAMAVLQRLGVSPGDDGDLRAILNTSQNMRRAHLHAAKLVVDTFLQLLTTRA